MSSTYSYVATNAIELQILVDAFYSAIGDIASESQEMLEEPQPMEDMYLDLINTASKMVIKVCLFPEGLELDAETKKHLDAVLKESKHCIIVYT
ncbi:hypothetical protein GGI21_003602, partial [Coemansia aciculifera]